MLHLYRRHLKACPHQSWTYRRCQCPIYVKGTLGDTFIKKSLDTNVWEAAQRIVGDWAVNGEIGTIAESVPTVAGAVDKFLADLTDRQLAAETHKKYRTLLSGRLLTWAKAEGYEWLSSLTLDRLTSFRQSWPDAPLAKTKNQERLRAFFRWCVARGWLAANPADGLSGIRVDQCPTLPFSREEMGEIIEACDRYPTRNRYLHKNRERMKAFVLTLRWSGLRISDVVDLQWDRLDGRRLRLYTQKTGTLVAVPLPDVCLEALASIRTDNPYIFRYSGDGTLRGAVSGWQRALRKLFRLTTVQHGHAHRFRDTFAVELLMQGVDLTDVSILLGHASVKITEKHYSAWVATRQRRLEEAVAKTWAVEESPSATPPGLAPSSRLASSASDSGQSVPAPPLPVRPPVDAPAPRPSAEFAWPDPASPRQVRTGTDDARSRRTRSTLRLVSSGCSAVQE